MKEIKRKENNKGITMVALIITVLVMAIIATISITSGIDTAENAELKKFQTEMQIIQARVDVIYQQIQTGEKTEEYSEENKEKYVGGERYTANTQAIMDRTFDGLNKTGIQRIDFKYYTSENLKKYLDLEDIEQSVLINWKTREVISVEGIKYKGVRYYQYDVLNMPETTTETSDKEITINPTFEKNGDITKVTVKVTEKENAYAEITDFTLKYKLEDEEVYKIADSNYIETSVEEIYDIEVSGNNINTTTKQIDTTNYFDKLTIVEKSYLIEIDNGYKITAYACSTGITPENFLEQTGLGEGDTIMTTVKAETIQGTSNATVGRIVFLGKLDGKVYESNNIYLIKYGTSIPNSVTIPEDFTSENYFGMYFYGVTQGDTKEVNMTDIGIYKLL